MKHGYLILLLLTFSLFASAQEEEVSKKKFKLKSDFQIGMLAGGQITNDDFVYKSGIMFQYSLNKRLGTWLSVGLGFGVQLLDTETIVPVFVDFKARFKDSDRTPFLGLCVGSTNGWSRYYKNFSDYEYSGGFYMNPYYAWQFPVGERAAFELGIGYIHQVGWIEYVTVGDEFYKENFAFDFLSIRAGFTF